MTDVVPTYSGPIGELHDQASHVKIQLSSLNKYVYELLWQRIASHGLRPGDKLSDLHLSEELGVSRTPVREALLRLAQDGIVHAESRRGFYVASFSSQDVREIYDLRAALEVLAIRLACPNLNTADLDRAQCDLDKVSTRVAAGDDKARETFLKIDREFHQMLLTAAGNSRLTTSLTSLQAQINVFQVYGIHLKSIVTQSIEHHQAIMVALRQGDCAAAEQAMDRHILEIKTWVLSEFSQLEAAQRTK